MNWKVAGMASTAIVAVALTGAAATAGSNKFTGNVSLAVGQSFEDDDLSIGPFSVFDDSYASITGDAQVNVAFSSNINLQLGFTGVGSFVDDNSAIFNVSLDRDASFQGDAHLYYRTDRYAAGVFGGAGVSSGPDLFVFGSPSAEYYWVGVEGQYYWNTFTLGADVGYLDSTSDHLNFGIPGDDLFLNNAWFADVDARWYVSPKFALSGNVGYISGDAAFGFLDVETWHWGAKAEYWPEEKEPLSLWIAYEGRTTNFDPSFSTFEVDKDVHTVKVGITFHFGVDEGNSLAQDREGPPWNNTDYGAIVVGG